MPACPYKVSDEDVEPNGILPNHGEGRVDTVERHPIDLPFPSRPIPPCSAVAKRAFIVGVLKTLYVYVRIIKACHRR